MYHGVREDMAELSFQGQMTRYVVHHVLEFDPTRKRMSVVVENQDGDFSLLVKGADTAILDRCIKGDVDVTEKHIDEYAMVREFVCFVQFETKNKKKRSFLYHDAAGLVGRMVNVVLSLPIAFKFHKRWYRPTHTCKSKCLQALSLTKSFPKPVSDHRLSSHSWGCAPFALRKRS